MKLPPLVKALFSECDYLKNWESFTEEQMIHAKNHAEACRKRTIKVGYWSDAGKARYERNAKRAHNAQLAYEKFTTQTA